MFRLGEVEGRWERLGVPFAPSHMEGFKEEVRFGGVFLYLPHLRLERKARECVPILAEQDSEAQREKVTCQGHTAHW